MAYAAFIVKRYQLPQNLYLRIIPFRTKSMLI